MLDIDLKTAAELAQILLMFAVLPIARWAKKINRKITFIEEHIRYFCPILKNDQESPFKGPEKRKARRVLPDLF